MEIKTKFEVGDLLERRYTVKDIEKTFTLHEVLEVVSSTCYTGTQVFYFCRALIAKKEKDYLSKESRWNVHNAISHEDSSMGWQKMREDELIIARKECQDIIKAVGLVNNQ